MHQAFWWICLLIGIPFVWLTVPLLLELLVLTTASLLPQRRRKDGEESGVGILPSTLRLAVIVPAHNEEALVGRCVESLMATLPPEVQIFVVAHNCVDGTAMVAEQAGANVITVNDPTQKGKASALREGFHHAIGSGAEACVVVDADSVVSKEFLTQTQKALSAHAGAVQAMYKVLPRHGVEEVTLTSIAFQGFNEVRPRGRERLGLSAGIFGNGFGLRREVLEKVPYHADSVVEDLEYHVQLVTAGQRVHLLENATVFGEMPQSGSGSATQRARWEGGRLLMMRRLPLRLIAPIVRGRGRLLEPLLDVLSLPLALGAVFLLFLLACPQPFLRFYGLCGLGIICFHFLAAVKAGPDFWKGMRVLARVPGYVFWKMVLMPKILLASRANAAWVRTQRETPEFASRPSADALE